MVATLKRRIHQRLLLKIQNPAAANHDTSVFNMNSSPWSSYNQQSFLGVGSPHLPPAPREDSLNNYGGGNSNSLLESSCQGLQPVLPRSNADPTNLFSDYESLLSPTMQVSKETPKFYNEGMFNGVCKENQSGIHNFLQMQSRNEGNFPTSENPANYTRQVPSINYNSSSNVEHPSPSPFGVLPHLAVKPLVGRCDRNNDNFIVPVSKAITALYNNGHYVDRDNNNVFPNSHSSHSVQSPFSADTASLSPVLNSANTSNFSSPGDFYSSPKTNFGAYKSLKSPLPQSPAAQQSSYPSSPFANRDPNSHLSSAQTPRSPKNGGTYVNKLNGIPARNGLQKQHSPSNNAVNNTINNTILCYNTQQSQNMVHHRPPSRLSKTSDYHSDYSGVYAPDQNSPSSYSSVYQTIHPGQTCNGNNSRLSPRGNSNLQNGVQMQYGHPRSVPTATISSPTYIQNKVNHEAPFPSCSSSMQPPGYIPCSSGMNNHRNSSHYPVQSPMLSNHIGSERQYVFSAAEMVDDKGALEMFNSHVDSGALSQDGPNSISSFLDNDLHLLNTDSVTTRQLRSSKLNECHINRSVSFVDTNKNMVQHSMILNEQVNGKMLTAGVNYSYTSSLELERQENPMYNLPRRRGRRGRRRGGNVCFAGRGRRSQLPKMDHDIFNGSTSYSKIVELNTTQQPKEEENILPLINYPLSQSIRGLNMIDSNDHNNNTHQSLDMCGPYTMKEIKREIESLMQLPPPKKRCTRSSVKRESKFLADYLCFIRSRKLPAPGEVWPPRYITDIEKSEPKKKKEKGKGKGHEELKLKIKLKDPKNPDEWYCLRGTYKFPLSVSDSENESTSTISQTALLSSHEIKKEYDSEEESNHMKKTGNSQVTEKHSAKEKNIFKNDLKENHLNVTNSETLPAGKMKAKSEKPSSSLNSDEQPQPSTSKSGEKTNTQPIEQTEKNVKAKKSSSETPEPLSKPLLKKASEADEASTKRRFLRSSRNEIPKEPEPGPSTIREVGLPDLSSEEHYENFDDSDSDPAWIPVSKATKAGEGMKSLGGQFPSRKRGLKPGRKSSTNSNPPAKKRKGKSPDSRLKKKPKPPLKPKSVKVAKKQPTESSSKGKKDTASDRFLIAKSDINLPTPFIWKVDRKSSMLQRFEISEQNGVLLYHSSFTYAAGNEICVSNYVTADVKVISPNTVQYLGPNLSQAAAKALSEMKPADSFGECTHFVKEKFDHLKEDFAVYIQSLLSQDVDASFLHEIKKFNDEYFLNPIEKLEAISKNKKDKLLKEFWSEELKKCVNTYPCVNVLDSGIDGIKCEVCEKTQGNKLLQFYGQPYDWTTLGPVETFSATKTQFSACESCSISVSLYNRLQHQKYNIFIQCRSKASEVKSNNDNLKSHEDVLKICLEDCVWIEKMFAEHTQIWRDCETES